MADVLQSLGLDTSRERPTQLTPEMLESADLAITPGCGEQCPHVPGVTYREWPVADPGGQDERTVRRIVADIDARVRELIGELVPDLPLPASVMQPEPQ